MLVKFVTGHFIAFKIPLKRSCLFVCVCVYSINTDFWWLFCFVLLKYKRLDNALPCDSMYHHDTSCTVCSEISLPLSISFSLHVCLPRRLGTHDDGRTRYAYLSFSETLILCNAFAACVFFLNANFFFSSLSSSCKRRPFNGSSRSPLSPLPLTPFQEPRAKVLRSLSLFSPPSSFAVWFEKWNIFLHWSVFAVFHLAFFANGCSACVPGLSG